MRSTFGSILYVEDDSDTSAVLACLLEQAGFQTTGVQNSADALGLAQAQQFDLYLLDHALPDGTGLDLCRLLREAHPTTPIVFFSARAYPTDKEEGIRAGANEYLIKPDDIVRVPDTAVRLISQTR